MSIQAGRGGCGLARRDTYSGYKRTFVCDDGRQIVAPVRECHIEQDFCSGECAMRFIYGKLISEPVPHSLWELLRILLGAKFELAHKADDFADEYFRPFIISADVVNDWLLFLNHRKQGYVYVADLNRPMSITKLVLNGDIEIAASFLLASILDSVGAVVSRGHWYSNRGA